MIKRLQNEEILEGLHLAWEVFSQDLASKYTEEAVRQFQDSVRLDNVMKDVLSGRLYFWGDVDGEELRAVCAMRPNGHLEFLFVKKEYQKKGIGRTMLQALWQTCGYGTPKMRMTIQVPQFAVEECRHMGFREIAPPQMKDGQLVVLMERGVMVSAVRPKKRNWILVLIAAGIILGFSGSFLFFLGKFTNEIIEEQKIQSQKILPWSQDGGKEQEEDSVQGTGIEGIPCYEEENLSYSIKEETYTKESNGKDGGYYLQFDVNYPQIEGMDGKQADKINQILRDCAMSTVDTLYLNPSDELKESMLQQQQPVLASQVTYKVTYAGEDFISVVFSDHYFAGNMNSEFEDLRTRNIRLSDGKVFTTSEIVELSSDFMNVWMEHMEAEAPGAKILDYLTTNEFRRILGGEVLENRYYDHFFVDAKGMEIGLTYHYNSRDDDQKIARGWITAPFTMEELKPYRTNSTFWKLLE